MCLGNFADKFAHILGTTYLVELCQLASLICLGINNSTLAFSNLTLTQLTFNYLLTFFWNSIWPLLVLSFGGGAVTQDVIHLSTLLICFQQLSLCLGPERPTAPNIKFPKRRKWSSHHCHPRSRFAQIHQLPRNMTSRTMLMIKLGRLDPLLLFEKAKSVKSSNKARK